MNLPGFNPEALGHNLQMVVQHEFKQGKFPV